MVFSSATIAREAMKVSMHEHMYRGGHVRIGSGSNFLGGGWMEGTQLADSIQGP